MTDTTGYDADHPVPDRHRPAETGELHALAEAVGDGMLSGGAPVVAAYEQALARYFGSRHAVAVNSGSSALHAALQALHVGPGSEVIVPAVAPLPTALPILTCGASPVIVDTLPGSLAFDPGDLERALTSRTRAAITVPLWGYPTSGDAPARAILTGAAVPLIVDAAQAHGTIQDGRHAGARGTIGCFSTHDRKLLSTGEGGFVLTDDPDLHERIEHYTRLGHLTGNRHGVNYKLAAPLAAIGLHRLGRLDDQLATRCRNADQLLTALPASGTLSELPYDKPDRPNYYNLVLHTGRLTAARLSEHLTARGLPPDSIRYRYAPLYRHPVLMPYARRCPNAEAFTTTTLQLPTHPGLDAAALTWIAHSLAAVPESEPA